MRSDDFEIVSKDLGKDYLAKTTDIPSFPVRGMIYSNACGRRCVCLTVQRKTTQVWVPFVIDGGSPNTMLGKEALQALDIDPNDVRGTINVNIHGFDALAAYHEGEHEHLSDVNVIGWTFFRDTGIFECMDPITQSLVLYQSYTHFLNVVRTQP